MASLRRRYPDTNLWVPCVFWWYFCHRCFTSIVLRYLYLLLVVSLFYLYLNFACTALWIQSYCWKCFINKFEFLKRSSFSEWCFYDTRLLIIWTGFLSPAGHLRCGLVFWLQSPGLSFWWQDFEDLGCELCKSRQNWTFESKM